MQAQGVDDFFELVLPVLEARGRYSRELPGHTLRDHLGLPRKASRHATAGAPRETAAETAQA